MSNIRLTTIQAIVTLLEEITTTNGYGTTVASVEHAARILFEEPADLFPMIDVVGGAGSMVSYPADQGESYFDVEVRGAVRGVNIAAAETLLADIKNCLWSDPTLGNTIIKMEPVSEDVDGGYWEHSWCSVVIRCWYEYALGEA